MANLFKVKAHKSLLLNAGIPKEYWPLTLSDYFGSSSIVEAVLGFMKSIKPDGSIESKRRCLLLVGDKFSGKTMLALCVAKYVLLSLDRPVQVVLASIFEERCAFKWTDETRLFVDTCREVPLLVLDGISSSPFSPAACIALNSIMAFRIQHHLGTVITSSVGSKFFGNIVGEETVSTIKNYCHLVNCPTVECWNEKHREMLRSGA